MESNFEHWKRKYDNYIEDRIDKYVKGELNGKLNLELREFGWLFLTTVKPENDEEKQIITQLLLELELIKSINDGI